MAYSRVRTERPVVVCQVTAQTERLFVLSALQDNRHGNADLAVVEQTDGCEKDGVDGAVAGRIFLAGQSSRDFSLP